MTDGEPPVTRLEQWVSTGATIVAPVTVLGALLFYFGYVSSRSQYAYFGIDVDTIGLSTQDYIMRSPQPLLVPLLVLTLVGVGFLTLNITVRRLITSAVGRTAGDANMANPELIQRGTSNASVKWCNGRGSSGWQCLSSVFSCFFAISTDDHARAWVLHSVYTTLIAFGVALTAYACQAYWTSGKNCSVSRQQPR